LQSYHSWSWHSVNTPGQPGDLINFSISQSIIFNNISEISGSVDSVIFPDEESFFSLEELFPREDEDDLFSFTVPLEVRNLLRNFHFTNVLTVPRLEPAVLIFNMGKIVLHIDAFVSWCQSGVAEESLLYCGAPLIRISPRWMAPSCRWAYHLRYATQMEVG
jgi:hypothetical protein